MQFSTYALLLLGFSVLLVQSVAGYSIRNLTSFSDEVSSEYFYDSGEPALVHFAGNNDNITVKDQPNDEDHHRPSVTGFLKQLGSDIVKGTKVVAKSVSESVSNGFKKLKNFFSGKKSEPEEPILEKELTVTEPSVPTVFFSTEPAVNIPSYTSPTPTSTTDTTVVDNEVPTDDLEPEIDVRILGGRINKEKDQVVYNVN